MVADDEGNVRMATATAVVIQYTAETWRPLTEEISMTGLVPERTVPQAALPSAASITGGLLPSGRQPREVRQPSPPREPRQPRQSGTGAGPRTNWVSAEANILGGGARFERMAGNAVAIGGVIYYHFDLYEIQEREFLGVEATIRIFPTQGRRFYIGAGLGFASGSTETFDEDSWSYDWRSFTSFLFTPEIGFRLGGRQDGRGIFINPFFAAPTFAGGMTIRPGVGVGGAW